MRVSELENPFRVGGVVAGRHFTDRADERRRIRAALTSAQAHLLVFGPRRMGKTSTLRVVQEDLAREQRPVIFVDLSTTSSLSDVTTRVLQAAAASLGRRWTDALPRLLQRLSMKVALAPDATGAMFPSVDVSLRDAPHDEQRQSVTAALDAVERLAKAKRTRIGVILDEFQELSRLGGEAAEGELRAVIQHHIHVSYVLAGSDERLIRAMTGSRRPLYRLLEPLAFGPMDPEYIARWIDDGMRGAGVRPTGVGNRIVTLAGPRTRDVVQLARATFDHARRFGMAKVEEVDEAFRLIVESEDAPIRVLWDELSPLQQRVLRALSVQSAGLTTRAVRRQFGLGETGPATKAARTLVHRNILVKHAGGYSIDSPFVRGWIILNALPDAGVTLPIAHLPAGAAGTR